MKRITLIAFVLTALALPVTVTASTVVVSANTVTFTGTANQGGYTAAFTFDPQARTCSDTGQCVGALSVTVDWPTGKKPPQVALTVKHLRVASDPYSYDQICQVYANQSVISDPDNGLSAYWQSGEANCSWSQGFAKAGSWTAVVQSSSGKIPVTVKVTGS